jgi:hypothetical protein
MSLSTPVRSYLLLAEKAQIKALEIFFKAGWVKYLDPCYTTLWE